MQTKTSTEMLTAQKLDPVATEHTFLISWWMQQVQVQGKDKVNGIWNVWSIQKFTWHKVVHATHMTFLFVTIYSTYLDFCVLMFCFWGSALDTHTSPSSYQMAASRNENLHKLFIIIPEEETLKPSFSIELGQVFVFRECQWNRLQTSAQRKC